MTESQVEILYIENFLQVAPSSVIYLVEQARNLGVSCLIPHIHKTDQFCDLNISQGCSLFFVPTATALI